MIDFQRHQDTAATSTKASAAVLFPEAGEMHSPLLLLEPASTLNTGNIRGERTVEFLGRA